MTRNEKRAAAIQKIHELSEDNGLCVIVWMPADVTSLRPDLSDQQAMEVLAVVESNHDATLGVNWDTLKWEADAQFPRKMKRRKK